MAFLTNIYESNAVERNRYIEQIQAAAKKHRSKPFRFFWLQAGDQLDLQEKFGLGFGFPALLAISPTKKLYTTMKSSFSDKNISQFLDNLMTGRESLLDLKFPIEFKNVDKWDGKDAEIIEEEPLDDDM